MTKYHYPAGRTTVYLPPEVAEEMAREAARQGRSVSWMVRRAWTEARRVMRAWPPPPDHDGGK